MNEPKLSNLFTIPMVQLKIEADTDELKNCKDIIKPITSHDQDPEGSGNNEYRVLEKYPKIKKLFLEIFEEYANVSLGYQNKFEITSSWITKTTKSVSSAFHNHKNCAFSGVYYFDEYDKDSATIGFLNPLSDLSSYMLNTRELNPVNANYVAIEPSEKCLIFFPSYLKHRINAHKSDKPRYSLAFNIVPVGDYGSGDSIHKASWIT
tara:strand:+ start:1672 stop:2292 length:621 start_codon:yes stop_codon:yes gene_type:complete